jgi:hypothetical protein
MNISRDNTILAVISGKNMIKGEEELHQILVYKINSKNDFTLIRAHNLAEKYRTFSKTFDFCYRRMDKIQSG